MIYIAVGLGGFFGSITRYAISKSIGKSWLKSFPLGTFIINMTGGFLLGFLLTYFSGGEKFSETLRIALTVGFIGAYTTFSTFSYETIQLLKDKEWLNSFYYIFFSLSVALGMTWLGIETAKIILGVR